MMVQNQELAEKLREYHNHSKKLLKQCKVGKKAYFLIQPSFPKRGKTSNDATSFLDFPDDYPECKRTNVTQMKKVPQAGLTGFEYSVKHANFAPRHLIDISLAIDSLLLKQNNMTSLWKKFQLEKIFKMFYTTKLSPPVLLPVSLRSTTIRGHTLTMLLTTSRSDGRDSSPVTMARRTPELDIIQSRCSAPFYRMRKSSLIENGPKHSKTKEDTSWRHRFRSLKSNIGISTSFRSFSLPK